MLILWILISINPVKECDTLSVPNVVYKPQLVINSKDFEEFSNCESPTESIDNDDFINTECCLDNISYCLPRDDDFKLIEISERDVR